MPNDCSNHKREIAGISDMKVLAEMIGDLHYQTLAELFNELPKAFERSAHSDFFIGNMKLYFHQRAISKHLRRSSHHTNALWNISKPYMTKVD